MNNLDALARRPELAAVAHVFLVPGLVVEMAPVWAVSSKAAGGHRGGGIDTDQEGLRFEGIAIAHEGAVMWVIFIHGCSYGRRVSMLFLGRDGNAGVIFRFGER